MEQIINIEIKRDISNLENADKSFIEEISLATEKDVKKLLKNHIAHVQSGLKIKISSKTE
jgi:hypothetical protein